MSGDLISLQMLVVFGSAQDRELFREGAAMATVPIEFVEAASANAACGLLAKDKIDIAFIDAAMPASEIAACIATARSVQPPPFVILVTAANGDGQRSADAAAADGVIAKPATPEDAKAVIDRCLRVRLPSRVLLVDDSATMRSIVRKILVSSRFPLDITEANEGLEALQQIRSGKFDFVFLDYNMPGLNGVETLAEIKREFPRLEVVMITSTHDEAVVEKARAAGAAAFLKKPFYPSDIDAVLHRICGLGTATRPHP